MPQWGTCQHCCPSASMRNSQRPRTGASTGASSKSCFVYPDLKEYAHSGRLAVRSRPATHLHLVKSNLVHALLRQVHTAHLALQHGGRHILHLKRPNPRCQPPNSMSDERSASAWARCAIFTDDAADSGVSTQMRGRALSCRGCACPEPDFRRLRPGRRCRHAQMCRFLMAWLQLEVGPCWKDTDLWKAA